MGVWTPTKERNMFLTNLFKALSVPALMYVVALLAVAWEPWNASPVTIGTPNEFNEALKMGFAIYQIEVAIFVSMTHKFWKLTYTWKQIGAIVALVSIPVGIIHYHGREDFFLPPWSILQITSTMALAYLIFTVRSRQQLQTTS
jgi:hypothetical protein